MIGSDLLNLVEATAAVCLVLATVVTALLAGGILLIVGLTLGLVAAVAVVLVGLIARWRRSSTT